MHLDVPLARKMIRNLGKLHEHPDCLCIVAHDYCLDGVVDVFPKPLNGWSARGVRERIEEREKELEAKEMPTMGSCIRQ
jgi:hypothetical protein